MSEASTIVLVTGANSGVGYAITEVLTAASSKYHVVMAGRSVQKLDAAAADLKASNIRGTLSTLHLNIVDETNIHKATDEVSKQFGRVDVLINNAGIYSGEAISKKQLEETFATNVVGTVMVTEAFKPLVSKSTNPRIIHVSSGLGSLHRAATGYDTTKGVSYRMSKAALNMYMIENFKELRAQGIKVWGICPGLVRSNLRGSSEVAVSAGGRAGDPKVSGQLVRDMVEGKRDAEVGKVVESSGTLEW